MPNLSRYDHISKKLIHQGSPALYQLNLTKDTTGGVTKMTLGQKDPIRTNRTILLVGETGTGKSTLINALTNYAMGVKWEDDVWFKIVEEEERAQSESQTPDVIMYEIFGFEGKPLPFSLTIVDTPGYGDTRGTEQDDIVSKRLYDLFRSENGVHEINVVGLVLKASENRLSDRSRYIFDSVVSLFGNDMEKNIVCLFTHSDGRKPKDALGAIKAANVKCAMNEMDVPVFFLFDNTQKDDRTEDAEILEQAEQRTRKALEKFSEFLEKAAPQNLKKTVDVLNSRIRLTACIQNLQDRIKTIELQQREIQQTQDALKKHEAEMKSKEEEMKRKEEDAKKHQEKIKQAQESLRKHEAEMESEEEEMKRKEEHAKKHQDKKQQAEVALKKHEAEMERNKEEVKSKEEFVRRHDEETRQTQEDLKKQEAEMEKHKDFIVEVDEPYKEKQAIEGGWWFSGLFYNGATCCTVCEENCHYPKCDVAHNPGVCEVMEKGYCTICSGKCPASDHVKEEWIYVTKTRKVKKTLQDMKEKYEKGIANVARGKAQLENLKKIKIGPEDLKNVKENYERGIANVARASAQLEILEMTKIDPREMKNLKEKHKRGIANVARQKAQLEHLEKTKIHQGDIEDVKEKYEKSKADCEDVSGVLEALEMEMKKLQEDKDRCLEEAFQHVVKLEQIALKADSLSTHVHLDFLIERMKEKGDTEKAKKLEEIKNRLGEGAKKGLGYKLASARNWFRKH
ncbi:uncharacterized protein LOC141788608 [Halichoeres trimaculatus]|uniref:uncharacterized protein LOC141788608 n=1 Tax=Halichoeres trimaculatus TaxID=147232 RepID=UPI003D9F0932